MTNAKTYFLADLIEMCDPNARPSDEDIAWLDMDSVGLEDVIGGAPPDSGKQDD